jgi:predicted flap endonuclease-1-like 5' DNA nuclease
VPVIVLSMVLVVVGFVTLMLGVLSVGDEPLQFVYVSIAACILAAIALIVGVLRGRPSKKPAVESGGSGKDAAWSGASAWNESAQQGTGVIEREEPGGEAATEASPRVQVVSAEEAATDSGETPQESWAPADDAPQTSAAPEDTVAGEGAADEMVVVPKRTVRPAADGTAEEAGVEETAAGDGSAGDADGADEAVVSADGAEIVTADEAREDAATPAPAKKSAKKAAAKKSAKKSAKKAAAKKSAKKSAKKAAAKAAPAKKAIAKRSAAAAPAAVPAAVSASEAQKIEDVLGNVSGVGPAKRRKLLEHFGTFSALQEASQKDLAAIEGISETLAARIRKAVRG